MLLRAMGVALVLVSVAAAGAEFRTWSAAIGNYHVEAELIELRDGVVHLRLKDGSQRAVPLEKLSTADQQFARGQAAKLAGSPRLAKLERAAAKASTAEERLRLYQVFCQEPETTEAERQAVAGRMAELRPMADKHMVWMRGAWATQEQFDQVRNQANSLMRQGIELLRLKQEDGFRRKFAEAAALEPDTIRADFLAGMFYALTEVDFTKSKQSFDKCSKRQPDNVAVLNNLALVELKRGGVQQAISLWEKAIELEPSQHLVQNLGRFLAQAGEKKITASKRSTDLASELYTRLTSSDKFTPASARRGWIYILLEADLLSLTDSEAEKQQKEQQRANLPPPAADGSIVIGGGTGFVVAPHYILTNNHVVAVGTSFEVQTSDGGASSRLPAKLVAKLEKPDLALLYCEAISAPALALDPAPCRRGTDIMTLGYPEMFILGASLKATRGVISAVPSSAVDDMYLYDAVVNHGNSGGPVCDSHGNVVAVTTIMVSTAGKYGGGIPAAGALEFVRKHVPDYQPPELSTAELPWPAVDEKASPSTLLIWSRSKNPVETKPSIAAGYFDDRSCGECNGKRSVACKCSAASAARRRPVAASATCPLCQGKKSVPCSACRGTGIDPAFQIKMIIPRQAAPPASPPTANNASNADDAQAVARLATSVEAAVQAGRVEDTPQLGAKAKGTPFRFLPPEHGFLIGLDLRYNRDGHLVSVRSVYQNSSGIVKGDWHGAKSQKDDRPQRVSAKPGYALGGLRISQGESLDDLGLIFMRIKGDRLDPRNNYMIRLKSTGNNPHADIGTGAPIAGIVGQTASSPDSTLTSIGLIAARPNEDR